MTHAVAHQRTNTALAERIMQVILCIRNVSPSAEPYGTDQADGASLHQARIEAYIEANEPISFVLPAFPAKSANPEKTIGILPDFGEVLALTKLNDICREIGQLYAPGARVVICSDGRVFSDLVMVPDEDVTEYGTEIQRIIEEHGLENLSTYNLDDLFPGVADHDSTRRILTERYAEPESAVRERVKSDPDARAMYNGIHRFLFEDMVVINSGVSRQQNRNRSGQMAYAVIQRSNAWSNLVAEQFPRAVRLSIHPQPLHSPKIGIQMIPSTNMWRTPWHSTVLFDGKNYSLVRRKDAEAAGAILVSADGRYPYFMLTTAPEQGVDNAARAAW